MQPISDGSLNHQDYAGFWRRFFAVVIDMAFYAPLYYAIGFWTGDQHRFLAEGLFILVALLAYAVFFSSPLQASPGMYLLKFRVTDEQGRRIGFTRALLWGITGTIGAALCGAGVLYLQLRFDIASVNDLMKSCLQENIAMAECQKEVESIINIPFESFTHLIFASLAMAAFLSLIWILSIALPKDKTGFHNMLCGTRFLKARAK